MDAFRRRDRLVCGGGTAGEAEPGDRERPCRNNAEVRKEDTARDPSRRVVIVGR
jgi:hypothetical protein